MHDASNMVFVNIIALAILITALLIYKFAYPRKNIPALILVILFSLLPIISIFREGVYESGDFTINIYKTISLLKSWSDGIYIARWAPLLNANYGYPLFIFTYPLPYYIVALISLTGISLVLSLKIFLSLLFIASGIMMYFWAKSELGKWPAFVAAIFYLYAPYHLVDLHFRVTIGELLAFCFLPTVLLSIRQSLLYKNTVWNFALSLSIAGLILSHQGITIVAFPLFIIYCLFLLKKKKHISNKVVLRCILHITYGLLLSSFYWLPVLYELKYTHQAFYLPAITFPSLKEFIYSPYRYGLLLQGPTGQLSFIIGYVQLGIILISVYILKNKYGDKSERQLLKFFIFLFIAFFILMQGFSKPIWETIPILLNLQFSYRILVLVNLVTAFIAAITVKIVDNRTYTITICILAIGLTILNWGHRRVIPEINDKHLYINTPQSTHQAEGLNPAAPIWTDPYRPWMEKTPKLNAEIIRGDGSVQPIWRTTAKHQYLVQSNTDTLMRENTLYFPGWKLLIDNKEITIDKSKLQSGVIVFPLNEGLHLVTLEFVDTKVRFVSKLVSLLTLIFLTIVVIKKYTPLWKRKL